MRTAISATVKHDRETWQAQVMRPLRGQDHNGAPLSSSAVVLLLDPDSRTMITTGGSDWSETAQVHGMSDIEWVDMEEEDTERAQSDEVVARRRKDGWSFYSKLDLDDEPDRERLFFTRPLTK